jgi:Putative porin
MIPYREYLKFLFFLLSFFFLEVINSFSQDLSLNDSLDSSLTSAKSENSKKNFLFKVSDAEFTSSVLLFPSSKYDACFQREVARQYLFDGLLDYSLLSDTGLAGKSLSMLEFLTRSKKSNGISVFHQQKMKGRGELLIDFGTKSSVGFFQREKFSMIYFKPTIKLLSKNEKYAVAFGYGSEKVNKELNGGIVSDSLFLNSGGVSSDLIPVRLRQTSSLKKKREYWIKNSLVVFNRDSVEDFFLLKRINLKSELNYRVERFGFYSSDTSFFDNYFIDALVTKDTSGLKSVSHRFGVEFELGDKKNSVTVMPYFVNGEYEYKLLDEKSYFSSYSFGLISDFESADVGIGAVFKFQSDRIEEFEKTQFKSELKIRKSFLKNYFLTSGVDVEQRYAALLERRYYANNFIWENNFELENNFKMSGGISDFKRENYLELAFVKSDNRIYFDSLAMPVQGSGSINIFSAAIKKELRVKSFGFAPEIKYTNVSDEVTYHYPEWVVNADVFFRKEVFKRKLIITTGVTVFYFSSYFADGYNPATDQYFLQNEIKTGNYPVLDYYLKLKIKRAELFIELNHFNEGLSGRDYFLTPHYPMPGRSFLFGLKWSLLN